MTLASLSHLSSSQTRASQPPGQLTHLVTNFCDMPTELKGSCHCGAVKFTVQAFAPVPYQVRHSIMGGSHKTDDAAETVLDPRPVDLRVSYMHESVWARRRHIPWRFGRNPQDRRRGEHQVGSLQPQPRHYRSPTELLLLSVFIARIQGAAKTSVMMRDSKQNVSSASNVAQCCLSVSSHCKSLSPCGRTVKIQV